MKGSREKLEMRDVIEVFRAIPFKFRIWLLKASNHNKKAKAFAGQQPKWTDIVLSQMYTTLQRFQFSWKSTIQSNSASQQFLKNSFYFAARKVCHLACSFHQFDWTKKLCDFISGIFPKVYGALKSRKHGCTKSFVEKAKLAKENG